MKFNFKKIATVLTGAVLLTSTIGFAAAASYPAPFSSTGGAVVYGANGAKTDILAAIKVANSVTATAAAGSTVATSGETAALFTGSKLYVNDSLNTVKQSLSSSNLPTVLAQGNFNGNFQVTYQQTITIGSTPMLKYGNMPTTSDPAIYGLSTSYSTSTPIYNLTVSFSQPVNFTDSKSKNRQITLFGNKYTVGSSTTNSSLVLLNSATTLNFDSTGTTSGQVTIGGNTYTVELTNVDSSGNAAITVTAADGTTSSDTVAKGDSTTIGGLSIGVISAIGGQQKYTASIVAGADKLTISANGDSAKYGDNNKIIDGTATYISGGAASAQSITISIAAKGSDYSALKPGQSFTDPVFKTFKLDFSGGMNIADNDTARENLQVIRSADDRLQLKGLLADSSGSDVPISFVKNQSYGLELQYDNSGNNISVMEGQTAYYGEYIVVPGGQDQGRLVKVSQVSNSSSTTATDDSVVLTDVATGQDYPVQISSEGVGSVTINGDKTFAVTYAGTTGNSASGRVTLIQSNAGTTRTVYPTIATPNGNAKVAFYEPILNINMSQISGLNIPNGNGFTSITWTVANATTGTYTLSSGASPTTLNTTLGGYTTLTAGKFTYNLTTAAGASTPYLANLYVYNPTGGNDATPGLIVFEGKDDASGYNGVLVTTAASGSKVGVSNVLRTWPGVGATGALYTGTNPSNTYITYKADRYGSIITLDTTTSDQRSAIISIPKEQVYGNVYIGSVASAITPGSSGSASGGLTAVEDSELSSVSGMNLVVVGGSCVNIAAAKILGSDAPLCGADFTAKTQVSNGQYIIEAIKSPYNDAKVAVLVAGYEAADTTNAVDKLLTGVATDVGSSQVYPIVGTA